MPGNTVAYEGTPAIYYELVEKFQVPVIDKITKKQKVSNDGSLVTYESPAIVYWDRDEQETVFKFLSFGGKPVRFDLWDAKEQISKKDGKKFFTRNFSLEFHSYNQYGDLVREVLKMNYNSILGKSIISKLASVDDFSDVNIAVGQFMDKENNKEVKYANVLQGKTKLKAKVVTKYDDKEYADDIMPLPPKRYLTENLQKTTDIKEAGLDDQGYAITDPTWKKEVNAIYENVCGGLKILIEGFAKENPEIPTFAVTESVELNEDEDDTQFVQDEPTQPVPLVTTKSNMPIAAKTPAITKTIVTEEINLDEDILNDDEVLE